MCAVDALGLISARKIGEGREGKGREWKGREGKGREGEGREGGYHEHINVLAPMWPLDLVSLDFGNYCSYSLEK